MVQMLFLAYWTHSDSKVRSVFTCGLWIWELSNECTRSGVWQPEVLDLIESMAKELSTVFELSELGIAIFFRHFLSLLNLELRCTFTCELVEVRSMHWVKHIDILITRGQQFHQINSTVCFYDFGAIRTWNCDSFGRTDSHYWNLRKDQSGFAGCFLKANKLITSVNQLVSLILGDPDSELRSIYPCGLALPRSR